MLMRGQAYKVFLDLEMPPSPTNEKLGKIYIYILATRLIDFCENNDAVLFYTLQDAMFVVYCVDTPLKTTMNQPRVNF